MKEIKINSTLVILITTLVFLFAGHYIYQTQFLEKPLQIAVDSVSNVSLKSVSIQPKNVRVTIGTTPGFSLKQYPVLRQKVQESVGRRTLDIILIDHANPFLEEIWQEMIFSVQEGLVRSRYTQIYETITTSAKANNIKSIVSMDDNYLYIELRQNNNYLLRVYSLDKVGSNVNND